MQLRSYPCFLRSPASSVSSDLFCHSAEDKRVPHTRGGPKAPADAGPPASSAHTHDGAWPSEFPRLTGGTVSQLVTVSLEEARSYQPAGKLVAF